MECLNYTKKFLLCNLKNYPSKKSPKARIARCTVPIALIFYLISESNAEWQDETRLAYQYLIFTGDSGLLLLPTKHREIRK